jgi:hypothetical protein
MVLALMRETTGAEPVMWGDNIVGFGNYYRVYDSGREGNWFVTGFSPRKQNLLSPLYVKISLDHHHSEYDLPAM